MRKNPLRSNWGSVCRLLASLRPTPLQSEPSDWSHLLGRGRRSGPRRPNASSQVEVEERMPGFHRSKAKWRRTLCVPRRWWRRVRSIFRLRRRWRIVCGVVSCLVAVGCDPAAVGALAVAPRPETTIDSTMRTSMFAAVARIVQRWGGGPVDPAPSGVNAQQWIQCFGVSRQDLSICGKQRAGELQFFVQQMLTSGFTPVAKAIQREISDSLQAEFPGVHLPKCKWKFARDAKDSGCEVLAVRDTRK